MKKVTSAVAKSFVCERCFETTKGIVEPDEFEILWPGRANEEFFLLGGRLNFSSESEAEITARTEIGWMKFRECGEFLSEKKLC